MLDLRKYIETRGWTQKEAAAFFGETQPRISNLMKGEISRFSIDKLINMITRAGMQVEVTVKPQEEGGLASIAGGWESSEKLVYQIEQTPRSLPRRRG